jgi:hypothetical protein
MKMPGDKFIPSASREREVDRLLDASRRAAAGRGSSITELRPGHAIAKNETGAALGFGKPAMLYSDRQPLNGGGSPLRDWDPSKLMYRLGPAIKCTNGLTSNPLSVAVTTEPIANGATGVVAISGLAIVIQQMTTTMSYFRPHAGNNIVTSNWGWGRLVAEVPSGDFTNVIDLGQRWMVTKYTITSRTGSLIMANVDSDNVWAFNSRVFDTHGIAFWQEPGDSGRCEWNGSQWQIIDTFCTDEALTPEVPDPADDPPPFVPPE